VVETTPSKYPVSEAGRHTLEAVAIVSAMHLAVRTVWRPPSVFPAIAPIAYYAGSSDAHGPGDVAIWLNPDHPELVSPRLSVLTDEIPLFTELLLASVDLRIASLPSVGLETLDPDARRAAAAPLAANVAVVAKYSPYVAVDDAEFARRGFAFAVLRAMTPEIGGVAPLVTPATAMPPEEPYAYYAGRNVDSRAPPGWAVVRLTSTAVVDTPAGYEAWTRAVVLATADLQPPSSDVKRRYDAAAARDAASRGADRWLARRAFAAPYVGQVAALFGAAERPG
jgi:hypothetical protein